MSCAWPSFHQRTNWALSRISRSGSTTAAFLRQVFCTSISQLPAIELTQLICWPFPNNSTSICSVNVYSTTCCIFIHVLRIILGLYRMLSYLTSFLKSDLSVQHLKLDQRHCCVCVCGRHAHLTLIVAWQVLKPVEVRTEAADSQNVLVVFQNLQKLNVRTTS